MQVRDLRADRHVNKGCLVQWVEQRAPFLPQRLVDVPVFHPVPHRPVGAAGDELIRQCQTPRRLDPDVGSALVALCQLNRSLSELVASDRSHVTPRSDRRTVTNAARTSPIWVLFVTANVKSKWFGSGFTGRMLTADRLLLANGKDHGAVQRQSNHGGPACWCQR